MTIQALVSTGGTKVGKILKNAPKIKNKLPATATDIWTTAATVGADASESKGVLGKIFGGIRKAFGKGLGWAKNHKIASIAIAAGVLGLTVITASAKKKKAEGLDADA